MKPYNIRIDYGRTACGEIQIIDTAQPLFSWAVGVCGQETNASHRVSVARGGRIVWDTGYLDSEAQSAHYEGETLISGEIYNVTVEYKGTDGVAYSDSRDFCPGQLDNWDAAWLCAPGGRSDAVVTFYKDFELPVACESACLFVCGLGYHKAYINGQEVFGYPLNPAFSEYEKRAYYSVIPLAGKYLKAGLNRLSVRVASGWRNPELICYTTGHCTVAYSGKTVLSALLRFNMGASGITWLLTDESWRVYSDAVTQSDLFMG
ncbi:MAG: alpha-L-rhamnosidase N-terminal domain-containing protein, partial [Clostridia bacterium]|nr:alpha-L-rhamnosidase N-terminal domain-containing protein [Clostridia bacterium]